MDWSTIPKIDAHIHLTPKEVIDANSGYDGKFITHGSAKDYVRLMEKYNIEKAFIMPFNDPYMLSMAFTVEAVHDNLLKMAQAHKGKFYCFADVDLRRDISETLEALDQVFQSDFFIGIKLHPTNGGYPVDGLYYDAIFKYAEENNLLLEIHSYPRASLKDDVCSPGRIITLLDKYPRARVSIAHLGGFQYEDFLGAEAYFNFSAILTDWVDRYGIERTNAILRSLNVDRLVFATDYPDNRSLEPEGIYPRYFEILGQMDFSREEAEKICRDNALRMIGKACL